MRASICSYEASFSNSSLLKIIGILVDKLMGLKSTQVFAKLD